MPLLRGRLVDIQAAQVEVGRIRLGTSTPKTARSGKTYNEPVRLDRFRLTSRSRQLIEEAAALYGGQPGTWTPQGSRNEQWEVIIERDSIAVVVPPAPVSQFYEVWSGGKCQRRCDGMRELLEDQPCVCGPDREQRLCKPVTRLSLMLAEMRGVGLWRLETHGYYAAAELPAMADLLSAAGGNVPARLEMEPRQAEVADPRNPGKTLISTFMVPVLHVEATPAEIIQMFNGHGPAAITAPPARPELPATSTAPTSAVPGAPDNQEELRASWIIYQGLLEAIAGATTREQMIVIRGRVETSPLLVPDHVAELQTQWSARAKQLAAAPPPNPTDSPPVPQPPPPAQTPVQPALDRSALWQAIMKWAGFQNLKLSDLKQRWGQDHPGAGELNQADAAQLKAWGDKLGVGW